jgi:ATP-dependent exoDNAse (exonuclease V) beta subunit
MADSILKLEASAGSGKTYRLALEYLGHLLRAQSRRGQRPLNAAKDRGPLGSILAITFTVKAAQEMKRRIIKMLKAFALSSRGQKLEAEDEEFLVQLAGQTGLSGQEIVALSADLIELVLASYDDFNVKTIDSLMSAMVKVIAPDLDLPADYEIAVKDDEPLRACARSLLADLADRDWPRVAKTLFGLNRLSSKGSWKMDEALGRKLIELFHFRMRHGLQPDPDRPRDGLSPSALGAFKEALGRMLAVIEAQPAANGRNVHVNGQQVSDTLRGEMTACLGGAAGLFRLEQLLLKPFFRKDDPRRLLKKSAPPAYAAELAAAYDALRPCQQALLLELSRLKAFPQRELFPDFVSAWLKDKDTLFVEEFSQTLADLFSQWRESAFPYLYLKMSDRFRNFLFDEFQDTSTLQFKALAPLIDEVLSRDKWASLFLVGDRKQAVYRWRGGNSELMEEGRLRAEVPAIAHLGRAGFSRSLDKNWRSRKEIVSFNNRFWAAAEIAAIAAAPELRQAIADNFQDSRQELPAGAARAGGFVEISLSLEAEKTDPEPAPEEAAEDDGGALSAAHLDTIEGIIRRLHDEHGYDHSQIAVLLRKNDQVRAVVRRLGRRGIDSVSDRSLMLDSNPRINEIIAFFRFLDYPPDDLNFFAFISGELFSKKALALFPAEAASFSEEVFIGCRGPFYKLFQAEFPHCWQALIEPFFQAVGFLPPYDIFSDLTQTFSAYENFSCDTAFFMTLGDVLHNAERQGGSSIAGFLRLWKQMAEDEETPTVAIPEKAPGVRVLTMHQSKGLEFPAVIVPINDRAGRGDDSVRWDEDGVFFVNSDYAQAHPGLKDKYQKENIRGSIDLLNLLYVAFTRPREALFVPVAVSAAIKAPDPSEDGLVKKITRASDIVGRHPWLAWFRDNSMRHLACGTLARKEKTQPPPAGPAPIPSKTVLTRSWQRRYLVFKGSETAERRDRAGARRGELVHDLLSRLHPPHDPHPLDARVRELAAAAGLAESDAELLATFLGRDDVGALLEYGHEVQLEKEIVDQSGPVPELRRLDRLQIGSEEVRVIDFKTGGDKSPDHGMQMRRYLQAVAPLYPDLKCRGFLLYIDLQQIEEVPCSN